MRRWFRLLPEGVERRGRNCRACRIRQTVSNFGEVDVGAFWLPCWRKSCRERGDAARSRSRQATNVARLIRRAGRTPRSPFSRFCIALPVMVPVRPWAAGNRGRKLRLWFASGFVQPLHIWRSIEWEHGLFY